MHYARQDLMYKVSFKCAKEYFLLKLPQKLLEQLVHFMDKDLVIMW